MNPQTFATFDEFAASLGHSSLRITVLGREREPWATCSCELDGVRVRWGLDGSACLYEAAIEADAVSFLACLDSSGRATGNGIVFSAESVMAIPPRTEFEAAALDTLTWLSVIIPVARWHALDDEATRLRLPASRVIEPPPGEGRRFRALLGRILAAARAGVFDFNPAGRRRAAQEIIGAARDLLDAPLSGVAHLGAHPGRRLMPRSEIVRRVRRFLDHQDGQPLALEDLARAAGVSGRTLHDAFKEQFGLSPKRFLRLRHLNAARRELLCADSGPVRVTDVATRLGIWELGRFARDYHTLFGELPSETLRRTGGRVGLRATGRVGSEGPEPASLPLRPSVQAGSVSPPSPVTCPLPRAWAQRPMPARQGMH